MTASVGRPIPPFMSTGLTKSPTTVERAFSAYLDSGDGSHAEEHALHELLAAARPVISASLRARARGLAKTDREELANETMVRLIQRVSEIKKRKDGAIISNFTSYVAITANNTVFSHLRRAHPERRRVRESVREALSSPAFARWETGSGEMVAGFRTWSGSDCTAAVDDLAEVAGRVPAPGSMTRRNVEIVLEQTFRTARCPIAVERLVEIVAGSFGRSLSTPGAALPTAIADAAPSVEQKLIDRSALAAAWSEICLLPPRQRSALLLNLRDGEGSPGLSLLVERGIASMADIAAATGLSTTQLKDLWERLPLDDLTIAQSIGSTRQNVINLRKSARERLARRLRRLAAR